MGENRSSYPLPICEALRLPYWRVNLLLCSALPGWLERQSGHPMSTIIPWIDELVAEGVLKFQAEEG